MNPSGTWSTGENPSTLQQRSALGQEWCIHAQLTISHPSQPNLSQSINIVPQELAAARPESSNVRKNDNQTAAGGNNVHFQYSWKTSDNGTTFTEIVPESSGIQKFESWTRSSENISGLTNPNVHPDSGYNTEYNTLPATSKGGRVIQPYGRRCKSTCTITLSSSNKSDVNNKPTAYAKDDTDATLNRYGSVKFEKLDLKDAETQTNHRDRSAQPGPRGLNNNVPPNNYLKPSSSSFHSGSIGRSSYVDRNRRPRYRKPTPGDIKETSPQHSSRNQYRSPASQRARSSPPIRMQQKLIPTHIFSKFQLLIQPGILMSKRGMHILTGLINLEQFT
jgi:hypothetical protein